MTQRVVVVGATGHIGRPLCGELIRAGHTVVVFSRDPARAGHLVPGAADYVAWSPDHLPAGSAGHLECALGYEFGFPGLDAALSDLLTRPDHATAAR